MTPSDWDELSSIHRKLLRDDSNKKRRFGDKFQSVFHISGELFVFTCMFHKPQNYFLSGQVVLQHETT